MSREGEGWAGPTEQGCWGNPEAALPTRLAFPGTPQLLAAPQSGHVSGNFRSSSRKVPTLPCPFFQ